MNKILLNILGLKTYYYTEDGVVKAVDGINLKIHDKEVLGLVGESGCGKSTVALSIMRLVPNAGRIIEGKILLEGEDLLKKSNENMRKIRGEKIAMIFQDPTSSLNPVFTIGDQVAEAIELHQDIFKPDIKKDVVRILEKVRLPDAEKRFSDYPHEFSGGMRQRVMIAMALSCFPKLLIADEPTTSLDVTIQAQILELMKELRKDFGSSILLITHDLGVIAEMSDNIAVMYAGKIVEYSDVVTVFTKPKHPYTEALLRSIPRLDRSPKRLSIIPGTVPRLTHLPSGCRFHPRCLHATEICKKQEPPLLKINSNHLVSCFLFH